MQQEFYIFRHGQTDYNLQNRWQGCGFDLPLNATGREQAQNLANKLKDKKLQIIYSSNLRRAAETADIVAEKLGIPRAYNTNLREICLGEAEGLTVQEVKARNPEFYKKWISLDAKYDNLRFAGGESKAEVGLRMLTALREISSEAQKYRIIGIASHEDSILQLLKLLSLPLEHIDNAGYFHIVREEGSFKLVLETA